MSFVITVLPPSLRIPEACIFPCRKYDFITQGAGNGFLRESVKGLIVTPFPGFVLTSSWTPISQAVPAFSTVAFLLGVIFHKVPAFSSRRILHRFQIDSGSLPVSVFSVHGPCPPEDSPHGESFTTGSFTSNIFKRRISAPWMPQPALVITSPAEAGNSMHSAASTSPSLPAMEASALPAFL